MGRARTARRAVVVLFAAWLLAWPGGAGVGPGVSPVLAAKPADEPVTLDAKAREPAAGAHAPGRVLVRFVPGASKAQKANARGQAKGHLKHAYDLVPGLELLQTDLPVDQAIRTLEAEPGVAYAEPDDVIHASLTPNDPGLAQEWGLDQASDADIDAKAAWNTTNGAGVTVAVIDSGVDLDHPDLAANIWTNPGEIANNGIDDDDDGFVDDVHGWDFVDDDNTPDDEYFHGTHVAGTIAAVGNNGIGVVGVAYGATVMPVRILDANGLGFVSNAVRGIEYAARHGARISNNSWGFTGGISQPLYDAIKAAGDAGQLVVVAAGNNGADTDSSPSYPAAYDLPNILSVAAETQDDQLATFSNFGASTVDVAAPGAHILSTLPAGKYASDYGYLDGTSMASPHVAGVAALVQSVHPAWTPAQVKDRILETVRPVAALEGRTVSGGMVNAAAAVGGATNLPPAVTITKPATGTEVLPGTPVVLAATAVDPEQGNVASSITWISSIDGELGTGPTLTKADLSPGTHVIVALARDNAGHTPLAAIQLRVGPDLDTIATGGDLSSPVIAAAPDGTPVVAWTEHGTGTVVARDGAGGWDRSVVSTSYVDGPPDLGVEPDGTVRLTVERDRSSVGVFADSGILEATDDGGGFATGRVSEACGDDGDGCGADVDPSWARDGSGRSHVAFVRVPAAGGAPGNAPGLWHAVEHADGTWTSVRLLALSAGIGAPDVATGPSDAVHVAYVRSDAGSEGVYDVSNETGSWQTTKLVTLAAGAGVSWARVQEAADASLDVAWGGADGAFVRTRTSGAWGPPVTITGDPTGAGDLVRGGSTLHLALAMTDVEGNPTGVEYGSRDAGAWMLTDLDDGADTDARLALDGAGHVHVSYLRTSPTRDIRHATNATGSWVTDVVAEGWNWGAPAFAVDASGVRHVAVGRTGTDPGVWYGTDEGGTWSLDRVTTNPPDGGVGLAVAPDGTAAIVYAEAAQPDGTPLADPSVRVLTGSPGAWADARVAADTGGGTHGIARDSAGHLSVAFGSSEFGHRRIVEATDATGSWVATAVTPDSSSTADGNPSIAVDGAGHAHIAYESTTAGATTIRSVTDATGSWVSSARSPGPGDEQPSIAMNPSGRPRIAYRRTGSAHGIRLTSFDGSTWTTTTVSGGSTDAQPSVAVDGAGRTHVLYAAGDLNYGACQVPLCSANPGLRWWSDASGFGSPRRVTDFGDDVSPALVHGLDGGITAAFLNPGWRLGEIRLQRPLPTSTAPTPHLSGATTLAQGKARLSITFAGTGAAYRLQQSVNGGSYGSVGSASASTVRGLTVAPSTTTTRRFRVTPYDPAGLSGAYAYGPAVRVWTKSDTPTTTLTYAGAWGTSKGSSFYGTKTRHASAGSARATYAFTAREVAWISTLGSTRGKATVSIDGVVVATIDLHASSTIYRRVVFRYAFASSGSHTIMIRPAGGGRVDVDGFELLR